MLGMIRNRKGQKRKGQSLVEYALIIAGVALISAVGISVFGHKVSDMIDAVAVVLPGAHQGDNGPISSGHIIETTDASTGGATPITLDLNAIQSADGSGRLGGNVLGNSSNGFDGLIIETSPSVSGGT
ncbi:MAG: Flp family type IVb pilin [Thermoguttaceae bacterium]